MIPYLMFWSRALCEVIGLWGIGLWGNVFHHLIHLSHTEERMKMRTMKGETVPRVAVSRDCRREMVDSIIVSSTSRT